MKYSFRNTYKPIKFGGCECEDENPLALGSSLADQVWQTQLQNRQILINHEINESLIEKAVIQIMNINDFDSDQAYAMASTFDGNPDELVAKYNRPPIMLMINSNGGFLDEAFSLISVIESSATPVYTFALGKASSAGFLITLAGHKRFSQKHTTFMLHQGSAGISDSFGKIREYADYWDKCQKKVDKYILEKTKITKKQLEENFNHKQDWYMTAEKALKLGVIDEIV